MTSAKAQLLWQDRLPVRMGGIAGLGYGAIALLLATLGFWSATAPISGAAVASGIIAAQGRNVAIQHLEGGIVDHLTVREGDTVEEGDILLTLDPTSYRTKANRLMTQWLTNAAMIARLTAERDSLAEMPPIGEVIDGANPSQTEEIVDEQRKEFTARLTRYTSEQAILKQRVQSFEQARDGLTAQKEAVSEQLAIVEDELNRKKALVDQGLTNRFEYTQILRSQADLIGQAGVIQSEMASSETQRIEALEQRERLASQRVEEAVTRLNEIRASQADIEDQLEEARIMLSRTKVRSPITGIVIASNYNSIGSVIPPGGEIMRILPTTKGVVVEARVNPQDVDVVKVGQSARLRLSALNMRRTPEVEGTVIHISADHMIDEATSEAYYLARIQVTEELPPTISPDQLYPGMPVETFISTGDRTFLEYLARPLLDSFAHAFRQD